MKPDVYVKYESAFFNVIVYIAGVLATILLLGKYCPSSNHKIS